MSYIIALIAFGLIAITAGMFRAAAKHRSTEEDRLDAMENQGIDDIDREFYCEGCGDA
jgi:cbb3-type cytochrome oxidase subunit 3